MNGRFINDVVTFKCKDGKKREAMIIKDFDNGRFDVAYIESNGCKNVTVHVEENIRESSFIGESTHKETILPYKVGDLVAYYVEPEVYYLAHIVEVGSYNTVKVLLGDLFMNDWIPDKKKGDMVEVEVKNIRWDMAAKDADKETKIKYGYEPQELRDPERMKKFARKLGKLVVTGALCAGGLFGAVMVLDSLQKSPNTSTKQPYNPPVVRNTRPTDEVMNSYKPIERIFAEIYNKPLEEITEEEKAAITYLNISEREGVINEKYDYYVYYAINDGEEDHISFKTEQGIDSYDIPEFSNVHKLVIEMKDLKTIDFIVSMPSVEDLELKYSSVSDISILNGLHINKLNLRANDEIEDYSVLSAMPELKVLNIDCDKEKVETITEDMTALEELHTSRTMLVSKCPNLKTLDLAHFSASTSAIDYSVISDNTSLENVSITNANIDESIRNIFSMENLKSLSLNECSLRVSIDDIPDNPNIQSLSISNIEFIENYSEASDGFVYYIDYDTVELVDHMDFFNHFSNVQNLSITNQKLTDVSVLANLKNLETVDLSSNFITDFKPLSSLPKLKKVTIKDNPFNTDPATIKIGDGAEVIYQ